MTEKARARRRVRRWVGRGLQKSRTPINGLKLPSDAGCSSGCYFAQVVAAPKDSAVISEPSLLAKFFYVS